MSKLQKKLFGKVFAMLMVAGLIFSSVPAPAYAIIFAPGATLNPDCLPTDANCGVSAALTATGATTNVDLGPTATAAGGTAEMRFLELAANGANYVGLKASDALAGNVLFILPSADGTTGQVLSTNGSGALSWVTDSSGVTSFAIPSGSNANGGSITNNVLTLSLADGTNPGLVSTGAQTFTGNKLFDGNVNLASASNAYQINGLRVLSISSDTLNTSLFVGGGPGATFTGSQSTFVGRGGSGSVTTSGNSNSALGFSALQLNTTGGSNTAVGSNVLTSNTTGNSNVGLGSGALFLSNGNSNTAVGAGSGLQVTSGSNNTLLGSSAGINLTTGSSNIVIGSNISAQSATTANTLSIGNLIFGTGLNATGTAIATGNVGIGTSTPGATLHITPSTAAALKIDAFGTSAGNTGEIRLGELTANGSNYVGFKSADSLASNVVYALPNADGASGQVLSTNGTGGLSWATNSGASSLAAPTGTNANGGSISSNILTLSLADGTNPGLVSTGVQTLAGDKTFSGSLSVSGNTTLGDATTDTIAINGIIQAVSTGNIIPFYFADQTAFPSATTYHGAVAHSHADGALYYAHGGAWVKLLDTTSGFSQNGNSFGGLATLGTNDNFGLALETNNVERLRVGTNGSLLLGEGTNGVLGFSDSDTTYSNRLRITAGNSDTADNTQGASIDLHGNALGGNLDLVAGGATGQLTFWTNNIQQAVLDQSGNFGIGTATPNNKIQVVDLIDFNNTELNSKLGYQAGKNLVVGAQNNVYVGNEAGYGGMAGGTSAADENTGVGYRTLYSNTTGGSNTANGSYALFSNTTGLHNTANGASTLFSNTTGNYNTANGYHALRFNTTGSSNTASGYQSLQSNTTGGNNTASGYNSLYANTTGSGNTASGYYSLRNNTIGTENTASGYQSLSSNTTGTNNTASGHNSLYSNTTGIGNTASGHNSLYLNTGGQHNTAAGRESLYSNTTGSSNTAAGYQSLYSNTIGVENTATGRESLKNNTTGNFNTATGRGSLFSNTTGYDNTANGYQSLYLNTAGFHNTATGRESLYSNTTGEKNTADGYQSLYSNTAGFQNTASGYESLRANTTGFHNSASGYQSLFSNIGGNSNTANGHQSLYSNTTGSSNTANGKLSLYSNTTGTGNTASGVESLQNNTTGTSNTATGYRSLASNTEGYQNTATGYQALRFNTTGFLNTAYGYGSLQSNTTGSSNTATGYNSLFSNTTGTNNTANGYISLFLNTTGANNTTLGYRSLGSNTTGGNNTALGYQAGRFITDGTTANATSSNSLYLGYDTRALANGGDNEIVIGTNAIGAGSNSVTLGNALITKTLLQGNVGIGTLTPTGALSVTPTQYSTGTASQSATTITGVGTTFTTAMVGSQFVFANGTSAGTITAFNSATNIAVSTSQTVTSQAFNIGYTGLQVATTGNVGIGTTTPSAKLAVLGSFNVATNIVANSENQGLISTGGTVTTSGADTIVTYNGNGTFKAPDGVTNVRILAIAGGGGGGGTDSGGGGAGEYLASTSLAVGATTHTITVGAGGAGGNAYAASTRGAQGATTSVGSLFSLNGGGGGGTHNTNGPVSGMAGGSGGGASAVGGTGTGGATTKTGGGAGFAGASAVGDNTVGAGGGGAGSAGSANSGITGGNGGSGLSNDITGTSVGYAGGGGGAARGPETSGAGNAGAGDFGGGRGGRATTAPIAYASHTAGATTNVGAMSARDNSGGGGGGGSYSAIATGVLNGGAGGSGIVIVRFATVAAVVASQPIALAVSGTTGNISIGTSNSANKLTIAGTFGVVSDTTTTENQGLVSTGGTVTTVSGDTVVTYNGNGSFTPPVGATSVQLLVVAGGGSGGVFSAGGGGAGGMRTSAAFTVVPGTPYTVTVGAGGIAPGTGSAALGTDGANSSFDTFVSTGGGGGAGSSGAAVAGRAGGSGGGGSVGGAGGVGNTPATSPSQGNNGFGGSGNGGGGGAGGVGSGNTGGIGSASTITGTSVTYAAGGNSATGGGVSGPVNTGNGGGGYTGSAVGNGGSGIVVVRFTTVAPATTSSTNLAIDGSGNATFSKLLTANTGISLVSATPTSTTNALYNQGGALQWNGSAVSGISSLSAASVANTIDNLNFAQAWNWSTATTQNPMTIAANALTTGTALDITTTNASLASTNGFFRVVNTGASTGTTPFVRLQPNSTAGSGLTLTDDGNVGIGTTAPVGALSINKTTNIGASIFNGTTAFDPADTNINDNAGLVFHSANVTSVGSVSSIVAAGNNTGGFSSALSFWTRTTGAADPTEKMRILANGNVGIGTTTPVYTLHVKGGTTDVAKFENATGGTSCTFSSGASGIINCTSDANLKHDITEISSANSLASVLVLKPSSYLWNENPELGLQYGFIAQDVEQVFPNLVKVDADTGYRGLSMLGMMPYVVGAIQETNSAMQEQYGGLQGLAFNSETDYGLVFSSASTLDGSTSSPPVIGDVVEYLRERVEAGIKIARTLVAEKVVAVNGYFKRIFANELCLTDSNGELVCVTGEDLRNIGGQLPAAQLILPQNPIVLPQEDINPVVELEGLLEENDEEEPIIEPEPMPTPLEQEAVVELTPVEDVTAKEDSAIVEQTPQEPVLE